MSAGYDVPRYIFHKATFPQNTTACYSSSTVLKVPCGGLFFCKQSFSSKKAFCVSSRPHEDIFSLMKHSQSRSLDEFQPYIVYIRSCASSLLLPCLLLAHCYISDSPIRMKTVGRAARRALAWASSCAFLCCKFGNGQHGSLWVCAFEHISLLVAPRSVIRRGVYDERVQH